MAETALQIIKDAMAAIAIFPDEAPLIDSQTQLIKRKFNRMMFDWETKGIKLGFTEIDNVSEYVTVPPGALRGIIYNLAVEIHPDFLGGDAPPKMLRLAMDSMRSIRNLTKIDMSSPLPSTMPIGSGNLGDWIYKNELYPLVEPKSFLSNTGFTVTITTADTPVVMGGTNWVDEDLNLFDYTTAGRSTYTGWNTTVTVKANIYAEVASGTDALTFYVAKNGVVLDKYAARIESTAGTNQEILLTAPDVELYKNDYIELYVKNNDATANITVNSANIRIS